MKKLLLAVAVLGRLIAQDPPPIPLNKPFPSGTTLPAPFSMGPTTPIPTNHSGTSAAVACLCAAAAQISTAPGAGENDRRFCKRLAERACEDAKRALAEGLLHTTPGCPGPVTLPDGQNAGGVYTWDGRPDNNTCFPPNSFDSSGNYNDPSQFDPGSGLGPAARNGWFGMILFHEMIRQRQVLRSDQQWEYTTSSIYLCIWDLCVLKAIKDKLSATPGFTDGAGLDNLEKKYRKFIYTDLRNDHDNKKGDFPGCPEVNFTLYQFVN